jgi:hypothetical protein
VGRQQQSRTQTTSGQSIYVAPRYDQVIVSNSASPEFGPSGLNSGFFILVDWLISLFVK